MFVTMWAATLDWQTGLLSYVNAGHTHPLLRRGRNGSWEWMDELSGRPLGMFKKAQWQQKTARLAPGDELVLYTDGVSEAFSAEREQYDYDRLRDFLTANADERPEELAHALRADVAAWAEGAEQSDDITILVLEYGA